MGIVRVVLMSTLSCLAMEALPQTRFIWAMLWAAVIFVGGRELKTPHLAGILIFNILLLYLLYPAHGQLYYVLVAGIGGLVMGILHGEGANYVLIRRSGLLAAVVSATVFLGSILSQHVSPFTVEGLERAARDFSGALAMQAKAAGVIDLYVQAGMSVEELEPILQTMTDWITFHIPAFLYLEAIVLIFLALILGTAMFRRLTDLKRPPFVEEQMPWPLSSLTILGLALLLWGFDKENLIYYVGSNILIVLAPIAIYFGLAVVVYRHRLSKPSLRVLTYAIFLIMLFFMPRTLLIFLGVIGLFDSLIDYRHLRVQS